MIPMEVILDGDGCWPDLGPKRQHGQLVDAELRGVAALPRGTVSGKPTVTFRVDLPDGRTVLAETTLALFLTAADAFKARHGDPRS
jgi:hypothetical protein